MSQSSQSIGNVEKINYGSALARNFSIETGSTAVLFSMLLKSAESALFFAELTLDFLIDGEQFGLVLASNDAGLLAGQLRQSNQVALHLFDQLLLSRAWSAHVGNPNMRLVKEVSGAGRNAYLTHMTFFDSSVGA
jgi:hypothetical protein